MLGKKSKVSSSIILAVVILAAAVMDWKSKTLIREDVPIDAPLQDPLPDLFVPGLCDLVCSQVLINS
jgi:hypothetical protein